METKASHLVVGVFILVFVAGLMAFVMWVVKFDVEREPDQYFIYFRHSVSGLSSAAEVRYLGIPVGEVTDIRIDLENVEQVRVMIKVAPDTPIKEDTVASLEPQGITGRSYIQISGGSQKSPPLVALPGQEYPVIPSIPSGFETLISRAPELLESFTVLAERAADLLEEPNLQAIARTLQNIETITGGVAARSQEIEQLIVEASAMTAELGTAADEISTTMSTARGAIANIDRQAEAIGNDVRTLLADIGKTSGSLTRTSDELQSLIAENRQPIRDFSGDGLYELSLLLSELRTLVASMTRISAEFEANPRGFLFGGSVQEFEAP